MKLGFISGTNNGLEKKDEGKLVIYFYTYYFTPNKYVYLTTIFLYTKHFQCVFRQTVEPQTKKLNQVKMKRLTEGKKWTPLTHPWRDASKECLLAC